MEQSLNNLDGHSYFPPEFLNPETKESKDYGLQYAKAIFYGNNRYGGKFFYGNSDFDSLVELAQGRQSVDSIRRLFGFHRDPNSPTTDGAEQLAYIDIKVLNLAPKYINRAVAKIQRISYDIGLQAIDITSSDERADWMANIKTFYKVKERAQAIGIDLKDLFPDLDIDSLPADADEMLYDILVNPKLKKEIAGEMLLKLIQYTNNFAQEMREVDWDLTVLGRGHIHCYIDENGFPRARRINPKFWIGSYVENDNFERQEYAGFFDFLSVNQFISETKNEMSPEDQMAVIRKHTNNGPINSTFVDYRRIENYDGLGYIPVLKFYFRSEDCRTLVKRSNRFDSGKYLIEKAWDYKPPKEVAPRFDEKTGDSKIIPLNYTSIYGGTWVLDSDIVFGYGRKNIPRTNLVNATLPIKTFGTNFKEGRSVSFASQMIEPLYMANVAWNKIKEILAQGRMGVMEIDFDQIEDVAIAGAGGQKWTSLDVMKFFFQKNILVKRGKTNKYDQKIGSAIDMNIGGLQFSDYMATLMNAIQMLEAMTGTTAIESTTPPDRLGKSVMEKSEEKGDMDMEYLFNAHTYLYERTSHQMLLLGQQSLTDGKVLEGFIPALGKYNLGYFKADKNLAYCEYGMYLTRQPGPQEWAEFYQDVRIDMENGKLSAADSAFLREIDNLKQARQMLVIREKQYERKLAETAKQNNDLMMQSNAQSAQMKAQADQQKIQMETEAKKELIILQGKIDQQLQQEKIQHEQTVNALTSHVKKMVGEDANKATVLKQAIHNIGEKNKANSHETVAEINRQTALETEQIKAETKKTESKKKE